MDPANLYVKLDGISALMRDPSFMDARACLDAAMIHLWAMLSTSEKKMVISRLGAKDAGSDGD